ncbi:NYN domain-containing protein [Mycena floridula]|nr:NYN domain-containing protein [Mycena floridula]
MEKQPVAIFWDYENCHASATISGYELAESIRNVAHQHGPVKVFKAYMEISEQTSSRGLALRSELQTSGVSLTDCPHSGRKDVADKMMMVDMLAHAIDNPGPYTFILISGDRDFAYAAAILRLRQYRVVVISPTLHCVHASLKSQASLCLDWTIDIMSKIVGTVNSSQHVRRESTPALVAAKPVEPTIIPAKPPTPPKADASIQLSDTSLASATTKRPEPTPEPYKPPMLSQSISSLTTKHSGEHSDQSMMSSDSIYVTPSTLAPALPVQYPSISSGFVALPQCNATSSVPSLLGLNGTSSWRVTSKPQQPISDGSTLSQPKPTVSTPNGDPIPVPIDCTASEHVASPTLTQSVKRKSVSLPQSPLFRSPRVPEADISSSPPSVQSEPSEDPDLDATLAPYFTSLADLLQDLKSQGVDRPLSRTISLMLGRVQGFEEFSLLAEKSGIVVLGGEAENSWISLSETWKRDVSSSTVKENDVTGPSSSPSTSKQTIVPLPEVVAPPVSPSVTKPQVLPRTKESKNAALSSATSAAPKIPKPPPSHFSSLVKTLEDSKSNGIQRVPRRAVARALGKDPRGILELYKQAGVEQFRDFISLAQKSGIVAVGRQDGEDWISLGPNYGKVP